MSEAWKLQRSLLLRKLAQQKAEIAALRSEVALLRMRRPMPPLIINGGDISPEMLERMRLEPIRIYAVPPPQSEEDDPPRT